MSYGTTHAVRGLDLTIAAGEVVCLLGPNGAGKTSVLRAVSGLVPYEGTIRFDGNDVRGWGPARLARAGLIHVPEGRHVFPTLSVHENLQMGEVARAGRPARYGFDDVYDLLPALRPLRRRSGFALSGGEQQMVALGRALIASPRLLLLDEPSLGLAPSVNRVVYEALKAITADIRVLLVEQKAIDALDLAGRGLVLVAGQEVMQVDSGQLADRQAMLASYLGQRDAQPDEVRTAAARSQRSS
ncbi:ABC transporter ATP-binding protein [Saccharopolyspora sp. NPDC000995]